MVATKKFFYGRGCERCNNTGYKGRMGIYELIVMNDYAPRHGRGRGVARRLPRGLPQVRHAHPPRVGPAWPSTPGRTSIDEIIRETMLDDDLSRGASSTHARAANSFLLNARTYRTRAERFRRRKGRPSDADLPV